MIDAWLMPVVRIIPLAVKGKLLLPFYHSVNDKCPKHIRHLYSSRSTVDFLRDLDFLLHHYKPLSLKELYDKLNQGEAFDSRTFHLTFDDGFRECHDIIAPILKRKGVPATFFVCTGFLDNKRMFFRNIVSLLIDEFGNKVDRYKENNLAKLFSDHGIEFRGLGTTLMALNYQKAYLVENVALLLEYDLSGYVNSQKPYLTTEQIKALASDGFSIGSHSIDHPLYQSLTLEQQVCQTKQSMADIEKILQVGTRAFAFPHNDNNVPISFFKETSDAIDIYFGTNRMKRDPVPKCLQRISLEDNRFTCEEIVKRNLLLQAYYEVTFRGSVKRAI